jgi:hypothetical protein
MSFAVWNKRSVFKDQLIGQGELKLQPLQGRAEIKEWVKLRNSDGKQAGDLEVILRLRQPLEGRDIRQTVHDLLVIGDFPEERPLPLPQGVAVKRPAAAVVVAPTPPTISHEDEVHLQPPTAEILGEVEDLNEDDVKDSDHTKDEEDDLKDIENDTPATVTTSPKAAQAAALAAASRAATTTAPKAEAALPAGVTALELRDPLQYVIVLLLH